MNDLAGLLARPDALSARLKFGSLEPVKLQKQVAIMTGSGASNLSLEETGALQHRVHEAASLGAMEQLRGRDIREACKVMIQGPTPLIENKNTANALFAEVKRSARRSGILALIGTYLDGFHQSEAFDEFSRRLRPLIQKWEGRAIDPWPELGSSFALFDPSKAPSNIASAVLVSDHSPARTLSAMGLDVGIRQRGGLAEMAFVRAAELIAVELGAKVIPMQQRLAEWAMENDKSFAFPKAFLSAVRAFLAPWTNADPPEAHRAYLIEILQSFGGGDPRTKPSAWRTVREQIPEAYDVLMRWLTSASVYQFFDIVDRSLERDPAGRKMWAYRRKFWTAYLRAEDGEPKIEEAWVAFGDDGAWLAREAAKIHNEAGLAAFGRQHDKSSSHAALIMRIGDLVIVDWSHNAKCNVWKKGDRGSPELYKSSYPAGVLYSAPDQYSHPSPSTYSWQKTIAHVIEGRYPYSERRSWRPKLG